MCQDSKLSCYPSAIFVVSIILDRFSSYDILFTKLIELQLQIRKMLIDDPTLGPEEIPKEEMQGYYYNLKQFCHFTVS